MEEKPYVIAKLNLLTKLQDFCSALRPLDLKKPFGEFARKRHQRQVLHQDHLCCSGLGEVHRREVRLGNVDDEGLKKRLSKWWTQSCSKKAKDLRDTVSQLQKHCLEFCESTLEDVRSRAEKVKGMDWKQGLAKDAKMPAIMKAAAPLFEKKNAEAITTMFKHLSEELWGYPVQSTPLLCWGQAESQGDYSGAS